MMKEGKKKLQVHTGIRTRDLSLGKQAFTTLCYMIKYSRLKCPKTPSRADTTTKAYIRVIRKFWGGLKVAISTCIPFLLSIVSLYLSI